MDAKTIGDKSVLRKRIVTKYLPIEHLLILKEKK